MGSHGVRCVNGMGRGRAGGGRERAEGHWRRSSVSDRENAITTSSAPAGQGRGHSVRRVHSEEVKADWLTEAQLLRKEEKKKLGLVKVLQRTVQPLWSLSRPSAVGVEREAGCITFLSSFVQGNHLVC